MSERDDMNEQVFHGPGIVAMPIDAYEIHLNRLAQRFYEASHLALLGTDKPKVIAGLRAVFSQSETSAESAADRQFPETVLAPENEQRSEDYKNGYLAGVRSVAASVPETPEENVAEQVHFAEQGLDYMLGLQLKIESVWGRNVDPSDPEAVSKYIREVILCAEDELHEVLGEVHWKPWKDSRGIKDISKYRGEMADVLHFILDLYLAGGITGREIIADYLAKHYENIRRNKSAIYKAS